MQSQVPAERLHLRLEPTGEDVFEPDYVAEAPLVKFVAFAGDDRMFGWVRLTAARLTDLLDAHEELLLTDVEIEDLEDGTTRSVDEVVVRCADLIAVEASGPRGDEGRRQRTRRHAVAIGAGDYLIGGYLHASPGGDPIASLAARPRMVPLTDAWIEYWSGADRTSQSCGTIIVNRERIDWLRVVSDEELLDGVLRPGVVGGAGAPATAAAT